MAYVDGFVLPLKEGKLEEYRGHAQMFADEARKLGAISVECLGDGLEQGKLTSFPRSVMAEEGENVVFSFIIWRDKAARDAGWEKIMAMPELMPQGEPPFDGKRMYWGGFEPLVGADDLAAMLGHLRQPAEA